MHHHIKEYPQRIHKFTSIHTKFNPIQNHTITVIKAIALFKFTEKHIYYTKSLCVLLCITSKSKLF